MKRGIRYCLAEEGQRLDKIGSADWKRLVEQFQRPDFQTVLDERPLLFVFGQPTHLGRLEWDDLRRQTLAAHVCEAVQWARTHRDLNPANAVIISAWNEHDEADWLQPTRGADRKPDDSRVNALGIALRGLQSLRKAQP